MQQSQEKSLIPPRKKRIYKVDKFIVHHVASLKNTDITVITIFEAHSFCNVKNVLSPRNIKLNKNRTPFQRLPFCFCGEKQSGTQSHNCEKDINLHLKGRKHYWNVTNRISENERTYFKHFY
jgi:hypothetical protein